MAEQKQIDKKVEEQVSVILEDLKNRKNGISEVNDNDRNAHKQFLENMSRMPSDSWQHFIKIKDNCIGCGI